MIACVMEGAFIWNRGMNTAKYFAEVLYLLKEDYISNTKRHKMAYFRQAVSIVLGDEVSTHAASSCFHACFAHPRNSTIPA